MTKEFFLHQCVATETAAILDFVCSSWEHDIFVGDCPNSINICMLLPESIPQGKNDMSISKKIFFIIMLIFYTRKMLVTTYIHVPLYKHCDNFPKENPCLPLQLTLKMYCAKFHVITLKNNQDIAKLNNDLF